MNEEQITQLNVMIAAGKNERVVEYLKRYLMRNEKDFSAWVMLANTVLENDKKIIYLEKAHALRPNDLQVNEAIGQLRQIFGSSSSNKAKTSTLVKKTAKNRQNSGASTKALAEYYMGFTRLGRILLTVIFLSLILSTLLLLAKRNQLISVIAFLGCIVYGMYEFFSIRNDYLQDKNRAEAYTKGAIGEMNTGEELGRLGSDFCVWHDVPSKYGNIDHIVLHNKGLLVLIETKAHSGTVSLQGNKILINNNPTEKDFLSQCLGNIYYLRDAVFLVTGKQVWINAVLVFTNAYVPGIKPINNIRIVNIKYLNQAIQEIVQSSFGEPEIWNKVEDLDYLFDVQLQQQEEFNRKYFNQMKAIGKMKFKKEIKN